MHRLAKKFLLGSSLFLALGAGASPMELTERQEQVGAPVTHIVAFRFKEGVSEGRIDEVVSAFRALKKQIPTIVTLEAGVNNSTEGLNKGFTHGFVLTFANTADRDAYVSHTPAHEDFKRLVGPLVDDVFVLDFGGERADRSR